MNGYTHLKMDGGDFILEEGMEVSCPWLKMGMNQISDALGWSEGVIVKLGCAGRVNRLARLWASLA
jgi:hypothetical protein